MEYASIIVSVKNKIGRIRFNKPPLNILDVGMMKEINHALDDFRGKKLKCLVIEADGKAFSAGVDVSDHSGDAAREMIEVFHGIFRRLSKIPSPTLALVKGAALGGGCEVAAFCDLVIASERAKFGQPEIMVGVFPPVAAAIFPRIIPHKKGLELLLTGDVIRASEAAELGLVNHVLSFDNFEEESERFLQEKIASKSAVVLELTKKAFRKGMKKHYNSAIKTIEGLYLDELMNTKDANEGLSAFLEKRTPVWKDE